jgi:biopolymer transport protein ExbD
MPKVKIQRKSTFVDMTAMCDVAFLLLTFFMLTSNFTVKEPVLVSVPSSVSEIKIPETNIMTIIIDRDGKIFFGIDKQEQRIKLLESVGTAYNITFNNEQLRTYSLINMAGVPIESMQKYLTMPTEERDKEANALGIPADSANNQFKVWVREARKLNKDFRIAIKADQATPYPKIKSVMSTLQEIDENRYNLITSLETASTE